MWFFMKKAITTYFCCKPKDELDLQVFVESLRDVLILGVNKFETSFRDQIRSSVWNIFCSGAVNGQSK